MAAKYVASMNGATMYMAPIMWILCMCGHLQSMVGMYLPTICATKIYVANIYESGMYRAVSQTAARQNGAKWYASVM